jgi:hypothetical protein
MRHAGDAARRAAGRVSGHASAVVSRAGVAVERASDAVRRIRPRRLSATWAGSVLAVPAVGLLLMTPTAHSAARLATRVAAAAAALSRHAPRAPSAAVADS